MGRLEYGNIGNYYIMEPLFGKLLQVFPDYEIVTTFQMTNHFIYRNQIHIYPMELFYAWRENEKELAKAEYDAVIQHNEEEMNQSAYITLVKECSMVIDFSGDMWGDNAEHVGRDRFWVDLYKIAIAQQLGIKTVLFAGTPGPFSEKETRDFAKKVFAGFDVVMNRESTSTKNLQEWKFDMSKVEDYACPAFLYEPKTEKNSTEYRNISTYIEANRPVVGMSFGGFNMPVGPYDMWPREETQYEVFTKIIEYVINDLNATIVLISHTNGFEWKPDFCLINGRDYYILNQLKDIVLKRGIIRDKERLKCIDYPLLPSDTKRIIGTFDMMIAGRVHASVAAISQNVPTVFLEYDERIIYSTKMYGFSSLAGMEKWVCRPSDEEDIIDKITKCYKSRNIVREELNRNIPVIKKRAEQSFKRLRDIVDE